MIAKDDIIGIVLAGGKSSRFGSNKALYIHEQQTLLEHSLQLLKPLCQQVCISGCYSEYQKFDVSCIPDLITNIGPLGGIYSAMKNFNSPYYLFLTCDMPFMEEALLQRLLTI